MKIKDKALIWNIALGISIILGFIIRICGIGNVPLAIDEYYIVKSIHNILASGLPKYETGGYYVRGLIYQYIMAFTSLISGIKPELSYRFINVVFNLLAIPAIVQLGKKISVKKIGYIAAILFCLSTWEIEFSRFIRMYAAFQTIFIWYILFLYSFIVENRKDLLNRLFLLSILSVFVYEGCIFLIILNFLPLLLKPQEYKKSHLFKSLVLLVCTYLYMTIDFRRLGVHGYLPDDVPSQIMAGGNILLPPMLIQTLTANLIWMILFIVLVVISGYFIYNIAKSKDLTIHAQISMILLIALSLSNLFGLLIFALVIVLLINWLNVDNLSSLHGKYLGIALALNFIFWILYIFTTEGWREYFVYNSSIIFKDSLMMQLQLKEIEELLASISIKKYIFLLFNYPNFYKKLINPWFLSVPLHTILTITIIGIYSVVFLFNRKEKSGTEIGGFGFLLAVTLLLLTMIAILNTPYNTTRYSFYLYPLILIIVIYSIYRISHLLSKNIELSSIYFFLFLIIFVAISEDYSIYYLSHTNSPEVNLRMIYDDERAKHYYKRIDVKSPAEIVNNNLNEYDIVITTLLQTDYYLEKLDYVYINYNSSRFWNHPVEGGGKELWTGANLIYKEKNLFELIDNANTTVWVVIPSPTEKNSTAEKEISRKYIDNIFYSSYDKRVNVYKIDKSKTLL